MTSLVSGHCMPSFGKWRVLLADFLYSYLQMSRISLIIAMTIYFRAGRVIWKKRQHLRGNFLNPMNEDFLNILTITVDISTSAQRAVPGLRSDLEVQYEDYQAYSVEVEAEAHPQAQAQMPAILNIPRITREVAQNEVNADAWLYARSAVLYFMALLLVWVYITFQW